MKYELPCSVVRDLLPNYIEQLTSEESNDAIREHLESCDNCKRLYCEMNKTAEENHITVDDAALLMKSKKRFGKSVIRTSVIAALVTAFIIPCIIICFYTAYQQYATRKTAEDLNYFNTKTIQNIDALIGCNEDEVELWIEDTFAEDNLKKVTIENEGAFPSYINSHGNVKIFFILEDNDMRFFIEPTGRNTDKIYLSADKKYLQTVNNFCADKNADYKNAPAVCELCLYNFDKGNTETRLTYFYLFNDDGTWGFHGDEGPYNAITFVYKENTFVCENTED